MENRGHLASILPYIPVILRSSRLFWPPKAHEALKGLSLGPDVSGVASGEVLFDAIIDLRTSLGLSRERLAFKAAEGYATFFDELMTREDSRMWFGEVVPCLALLALRLPSLLEAHYLDSDMAFDSGQTGLRILGRQQPGIVCLSQELIAALLACSFFCLFPVVERIANHLPTINFDHLFSSLQTSGETSQEEKLKCLVHYFERVCSNIPRNFVSYERKVLPLEFNSQCISYPDLVFWQNSVLPLCSFKVSGGLIEDQQSDALEVDFANEYLGGGALYSGCVQEEIRFMISPELIAGMFFLPSMQMNEAIEIVGVERYSYYTGYASSFQYVGDCKDKRPLDLFQRRKTRIVAIDALHNPGLRQYKVECLLREANKAFCGFLDQSRHNCLKAFQKSDCRTVQDTNAIDHAIHFITSKGFVDQVMGAKCEDVRTLVPSASGYGGATDGSSTDSSSTRTGLSEVSGILTAEENAGIATGNWGCGAFGGDPEVKSIIQWLAASQALRPFIIYYPFGEKALQKLEQVTRWILLHGWTVGDLWNMLVEYSRQRLEQVTRDGFFNWLLPEKIIAESAGADYMSN